MRDQDSSPSSRHSTDPVYAQQRRVMVDRQIRTFDVTDPSVIDRMQEVPRELFLPDDLAPLAYSDGQLRVAGNEPGQTRALLAPLVLARLIQAASLAPDEKVLVVGDGPGYAAALISGLARTVVAFEADSGFAERTLEACTSLGITNVRAITGPLTAGYPPMAPYDAIFILGVVEAEAKGLYGQLSARGRILTFQKPPRDPIGRAAKAVRITRVGSDYSTRALFEASAPVLEAFRAKPAFVF